jgi:hypothetical protein
MRFNRLLMACSAGAAAMALVGAGSAGGATVTVGSAFPPPTGNPASGVARTWAIAPSSPSGGTASPVAGTVVSWRFRGSLSGSYTPRILRPAGGGAYRAVASGPAQTGAGSATPAGPFALSLPVAAGELFAVDVPAGVSLSYTDVPGATSIGWQPPLLDGGAAFAPTDSDEGEERHVAATIRYCLVPKLRGKSPKAARKALVAADCRVGKVKKTKKERKRKKVLSQSVAPGTSISDTAPVGFRISRRAQKR